MITICNHGILRTNKKKEGFLRERRRFLPGRNADAEAGIAKKENGCQPQRSREHRGIPTKKSVFGGHLGGQEN
jgi:hypothetical protein